MAHPVGTTNVNIRNPRKDWVKLVFSNITVYEYRTDG